MEYSTWALLLVAIGAVLLVAEVFIPSGGVIAVLAAASLVMAVYCAYHAWYAEHTAYFYLFLAGMVTMLPVGVGAAFYVWPNTSIGKRAILEGPAPDDVVPFQELEQRFTQMLGKTGETLTMLNPAGIARIDGRRVHCQSEGTIIDSGVPIRVISVTANRVVVRPHVPAPESSKSSPAGPPGEPDPLDFDIG